MLNHPAVRRTIGAAAAGVTYHHLVLQQQKEEHSASSSSSSHSNRSINLRSIINAPASLSSALLPSLLTDPSVAYCDANRVSGKPPEFHRVPLPTDDILKTAELVKRFKVYIGTANLDEICKFKKEKNGVKIYTIKEGAIPDPTGQTGLPVARVGEAIIGAPADQVATLWWFFNSRKDWDSASTLASEVVEEYGPHTRLVYVKGAAKPMISSRDFAFVSHKVPPGDLGGRFGSQAFLQSNAADAVPADSGAVRGNLNSLIVIEPIDAVNTRVRYVAEVEPKGWLPTIAVEAAADDLPGVLGVMKQHLEAQASEEDEQKLVERMEDMKKKDHLHLTLVDSVTASKEDLAALAKVLRSKLDQVKKDERSMGVPLTELKNKIQQDIRKVEARMKTAK